MEPVKNTVSIMNVKNTYPLKGYEYLFRKIVYISNS